MSAVAEQKQLVKGGAFLIEEREPDTIFTPEDFTEEHRMIADTTRQFIDNEVTPRMDEHGRYAVHYLDLSTGATRPVFPIAGLANLGLSVSPDRKYVLYAQVDAGDSDIMLVDGFR